jgi:hypothetical protein
MPEDPMSFPKIVGEADGSIDIDVGISAWQCLDSDHWIVEKDFKVSGDIWRVHLSDADPFPSTPHAHCIVGAKRFIGCKLHLGTRELFDNKNKSMKRRLDEGQFNRLIELVRPKFPQITLPLPL